MKVYYEWLHIPSGKTGDHWQVFLNRRDFLEKLAGWNRLGAGTWQYWERT